jgi:hypothetical protein
MHKIELTFTSDAKTMLQAIFDLKMAMNYLPESKLSMFEIKLSTDSPQPVQHADE